MFGFCSAVFSVCPVYTTSEFVFLNKLHFERTLSILFAKDYKKFQNKTYPFAN
ncbi:hypothetical protein KsCSTR_26830 [Candidatus Kuenenia stuttgartiensis]|uniref:Uncharacterized protein n=1 Tax=Kuenenia stuttgartiensis TaxID=174633 RepID=A0A6G7GRR2_KUEST|nr:hypothetical protein KsCSTR_26830 [Candidatus Kuenenia stuttgartiensis]